jgi:hypothetical protein
MSERRGCLGTGISIGLGLVVLFIVLYTIFSVYASSKLNSRLADLRAQGVKLKLSELAPQASSPERNAALVYQQAFDALRLSGEDETAISDMLKLPREGEPPPAPMPADAVTRARAAIQQNAPALALVRQASLMPECSFPTDWDAGPNALFPHYAKLRKVARMLAAAAIFAARDGKPGLAAGYLLDGVRVGEAPARDPALIAALVHIAIEGIMEHATVEVLRTAAMSPADCRRLAERYAAQDENAIFARAMQGERDFGIACYDLVRRDRKAMGSIAESGDVGLGNAYGNPLMRPLLNLDEAFYLELMGEQIARASLPAAEAARTPYSLEEKLKGKPYLLTRMLIPVFARATMKRDSCAAGLALTQAAVGLQAWKATYGRYPDSLAPVGKALSWPLRPDPYSGQPLIYKRQGDTFLLYSVGMNQKDDGGKVEVKDYNGEQGDIVWGKWPATK